MKYPTAILATSLATVYGQQSVEQMLVSIGEEPKPKLTGFLDDLEDFGKAVGGFFEGFADKAFGLDADTDCLNDVSGLAQDADTAAGYMSQGGTENRNNGLGLWGNVAYNTASGLVNCGLGETDEDAAKDVLTRLADFADPEAGAIVNAAFNGYDDYEDVNDAVNSFSSGNYMEGGKSLGELFGSFF